MTEPKLQSLADRNRARTLPVRPRLEERHVKNPVTGCWDWTGSRMKRGYGRLNVNGKPMLAHRASYEEYIGPIPDGAVIDHLCRNTSCINPEHLDATTQRENLMRSPYGRGPRNAAVTHCPKGHEYTPDGTYMVPSNRKEGRWFRLCGTCYTRKNLPTLREHLAQQEGA